MNHKGYIITEILVDEEQVGFVDFMRANGTNAERRRINVSHQEYDEETGVADGWFVDVEDGGGPLPFAVEEAINEKLYHMKDEHDPQWRGGLEYKAT